MASLSETAARSVVGGQEIRPPLWVFEWLDGSLGEPIPVAVEGARGEIRTVDGYALTSVRLEGVEDLDILSFQQSVAELYKLVLDQLRGDHALRFWAFVPRIHADYGHGLDRYMAFNAGRFTAFSAWLGGRDAFSQSMPTASAVG